MELRRDRRVVMTTSTSSSFFFFSSRRRHTILQGDWSSYVCFFAIIRRHTRLQGDWSSDVCSSDLQLKALRRNQRDRNRERPRICLRVLQVDLVLDLILRRSREPLDDLHVGAVPQAVPVQTDARLDRKSVV